MPDLWNFKYDWILTGETSSGYTWIRENRLINYDEESIEFENIEDVYFRYQKCLSGICYQYVLTLYSIYDRSIMIGDNNYIQCMYNEQDIINAFMNNFTYVDLVSYYNLDLSQKIVKLNNRDLKSTHRILLTNQDDPNQNGVYSFNINGYLTPTTDLETTGKTYRFGTHVKLDDNQNIEYFLLNSGNTFPTTYEEKYFTTGHTFMLKNYFSYNINQTGTTTDVIPKLWFTDYDFARKLNNSNSSLYNNIELTSASKLDIIYNNIYTYFTLTGFVNFSSSNFDYVRSGHTEILTDATFVSNSDIGDYLEIFLTGVTFTGDTIYAIFNSTITGFTGDYIILNEYIPDFVLSGMTDIYIDNLNKLDSGDWEGSWDIYNRHYWSNLIGISGDTMPVELVASAYTYDKYFDYDNVSIDNGSSISQFTTDNMYIKYKLYDNLNAINPSTFTYTLSMSTYQSVLNYTYQYTYLLDDSSYPADTTYNDSPIKITFTDPSELDYFYNNTCIRLNSTYKTFIIDKDDTSITIEHPKELVFDPPYNWFIDIIYSIDTYYRLGYISNVLYDVYKNIPTTYYNPKDDYERKKICNAYADMLSVNQNIIDKTTGTIYQGENGDYILKLFNVRNSFNTLLDSNDGIDNDINLSFVPMEILDIGIDKQTKMPLRIHDDDLHIIDDLVSGYTVGVYYPDNLFFSNKNIILVNGLTVEKLKVKYIWIFNAEIKNAIIGEDDYGLVWYTGTWYCGEWMDGTWYSGTWYHGIWRNGRWYSWLIDKTKLLSSHILIRLNDNKVYSKFLNGTWRNGEWYNGIFGDDITITGYTSKVFMEHTSILPDNMDVATWQNGTFHAGEFKNSIWENGKFLYGDMYGGYWKNGYFYNGTFDGNWWNGIFFGGDFLTGIWENGLFNTLYTNVQAVFGNHLVDTSAITCEWWAGNFINSKFYSGSLALDLNNRRSQWFSGNFKNSIFYGGHFHSGYFYNSKLYNGVFGTENPDFLISGTTFDDSEFWNGLWLSGTFINGIFRNGIWVKGTFIEGELKAFDPPYTPQIKLLKNANITTNKTM